MLKCKMCLGRKLKAKLAVLRSADRSIQYQTSDPIKIDENNVISLKLDSAVLRINNQGELTLDIPSQGDINSILNHLSNYLPSHSLTDSNIPLVTNGAGKAKWATDTIGSDVKPIFLNSGKITASNGNKGGSAKPIYMQNGEFKESSSNLGGATTPIYMQNGELKEGVALNNAAYRDVAASIDSSNKLVPSSVLKSAIDAINIKIGKEYWVLVGNAKQYGKNPSNILGWRGSVSVYKIIYLGDDGSSYSPDEYIILGCIEIPSAGMAVDYGFYLDLLPNTYNNLFPIPEIMKDNDSVEISVGRQNVSSPTGIRIGFSASTSGGVGFSGGGVGANLGTVKFCIRNKFPINKAGSWRILPTV